MNDFDINLLQKYITKERIVDFCNLIFLLIPYKCELGTLQHIALLMVCLSMIT